MRKTFTLISVSIALSAVLFQSCTKLRGHYGTKSYEPVNRPVSPSDILLPEGYKIEMIASGLNFPSAMTFDDQGQAYVLEAGYSYGEIFTTPKLLKIEGDGKYTEIAHGGKNGPWTAVDFYEGNFYISEGGAMEGGRILKVNAKGEITNLVEGLPSYGDHHTDAVVIGKDGYIYFGQGTATNSAVVGKDNFDFGWLARKKDFHDIPCIDVTLAGENYETENVLSPDKEKVKTGAYVPYGTATVKGQVIKGSLPCTGAVMRIPLNGGPIELVASGLRNPFGLAFAPDGKLYVTENGLDTRGSRPVFGGGDYLYEIKNNAWYGWPDYAGGDSLADENFKAREIRPKSVLLKHPQQPPKPKAVFDVHSSADGFDFSSSNSFGYEGDAFVALFGDMAPNVGTVYGPVGFKIVRVNMKNGDVVDFAVNKGHKNGPASTLKTGGLERPIAAKFDNTGKALYVVDFGVLEMPEKGPAPKQRTGVIWKITKQ
ncbi:MAG: glucose dehydrogenase [Bacteroidota bacterium]|jgi:glucose/arabinose dehydrogenase|nr:glucose dehydrogenase [Bacteroidota bacterium]